MFPFITNRYLEIDRVQVNLSAETGDMGVLANHVPTIEQLKPGLVEVFEESGGTKQFFRTLIQSRSGEVGTGMEDD
jgi:F0F1-type ATP synthase epsilon subunit